MAQTIVAQTARHYNARSQRITMEGIAYGSWPVLEVDCCDRGFVPARASIPGQMPVLTTNCKYNVIFTARFDLHLIYLVRWALLRHVSPHAPARALHHARRFMATGNADGLPSHVCPRTTGE